MHIEFKITDAATARDAIEVLAYVAAGFDPTFPAAATIARLPCAGSAPASNGGKAG